MGGSPSKPEDERQVGRAQAITGARTTAKKQPKIPANAVKAKQEDRPKIQVRLGFTCFFYYFCLSC